MNFEGLSLLLPREALDQIATQVAEKLRGDGFMAEASPSPFLTPGEAAELLRCDRRRLYRMAEEGRLEYVKDGRRLLVIRASLEAHLRRS
jgi:excisionase family DNA binding protein